ncbi:MAG: hypothetical protein AAB822_00220 [Patescibacteria group bacterium]
MKLKNFIFVGVALLGLLPGVATVLAENGTEECDAVAIEQVLEQARAITTSATFLSELKPTLDDTKKVVEELVVGQGKELARMSQDIAETDKKEYDEAIRRYFGRNSRPNPKND